MLFGEFEVITFYKLQRPATSRGSLIYILMVCPEGGREEGGAVVAVSS